MATLALVEREGLTALSMRNVAAESGVATMALYRYVANRQGLERLVVEHVLAQIDLSMPQQLDWQGRIRYVAEAIRQAVGTHAVIMPLFLQHRHSSLQVRRCIEALATALAEAGFAGSERVIAVRMLGSYINGTLQAQHLSALNGAATKVLAQGGEEEFPVLADTARAAIQVTPEQEFHGGLDIVLAGLAVRCSPSSSAVGQSSRSASVASESSSSS